MGRAVFHEEQDALAVLARLQRDGFEATLQRDRFAGEDDDEDHAWAVLSDAPDYTLELLADERDGWVDHSATASPAPPGTPPMPPTPPAPPMPLDLPDGPRRVKGHFTD